MPVSIFIKLTYPFLILIYSHIILLTTHSIFNDNSCKETLRRQKRETPAADFPEAAAPQGADPALWESLRALDKKYRIIVVLHYRDGYSVREIASILRVPESTVKTRLFRARQQLKSLLEREEMFA